MPVEDFHDLTDVQLQAKHDGLTATFDDNHLKADIFTIVMMLDISFIDALRSIPHEVIRSCSSLIGRDTKPWRPSRLRADNHFEKIAVQALRKRSDIERILFSRST
ncbi:hypothetical protein HY213_04445 [Candidatus Peregrinibacteria bacterium]|nr:hypothetical protein [Candidatus Peregrinibacteria bacterium]